MNVLIIQSPLMQLNTAYPSGAYLFDFFKKQGCDCRWLDLNIELFYSIFSRAGLKKIFELSSKNALKLAEQTEKNGDDATCFNLRRYVLQAELWCNWIEKICLILCGKGFESAHSFVFGAHVPRGSRMENFLENLDHDLTTDDARSLASYALADLADFITLAFDKNFSLVRYAESLTISESTFAQVEQGIDSPILKEFYEPLLKKIVAKEIENFIIKKDEGCADSNQKSDEKILVCISIPFPGVFAAALSTGRFIKKNYPKQTYISFGGGFINTELRETFESSLYKYCDLICYDRGYASYKKILSQLKDSDKNRLLFEQVYNVRKFSFLKRKDEASAIAVVDPINPTDEEIEFEKLMTKTVIPDFCDIDFSRYPRLIDDTNSMHRLWSDGAWIKAYMAHGCYWHKCAFCDVTLDYVKSFCMTDIKSLYEGLLEQCNKKGIYGIHFVDEAMPPSMMIEFARFNIEHGTPLTWWGNIRFEKNFTRDVADYLAYGGLIGVSAGLESATGNGLTAIHKGTDLQTIVEACCAFKEAGVLVHAYMIYGYWFETPQDLINSMETLRQFYANGLLDSSYWHKFVLTRHSRVYDEWKKGEHPELKVIEEKSIPIFAKNALHFEGEKKSQKYGAGLNYSLNEWMHFTDIEKPVSYWFDFPVPKPTVSSDFIKKLISKYEEKRDFIFRKELPLDRKKIIWLGGQKCEIKSKGEKKVEWFFMGEKFILNADANEIEFRGKGLCVLP
ncbi:B12-binding domain-containing radical SAM protein [Treponema pectinovorum]|uniref:B12-binding domain-containing radical SAM protein n=1 Tax=Treponema pectinovorum TaxID=164 RepID=UPI0011CA4049|nr:radical SAM protein [Treponema pectinovorum]